LILADALMSSLPAKFSTEPEQLEIIAQWSRENDECGIELEQAKTESGLETTIISVIIQTFNLFFW